MKFRLIALVLLLAGTSLSAMEGYYSSPSLQGDKVVFTAEGDLWVHQLGVEQAERLTTHPSLETQATISPDGEQIAFAADYEGALEVYVMPVSGGVPKRLTYENSGVYIQEWTADGLVLYSTNSRVGPPSNWTLKTVDPRSLEVETIPLADAFGGSVDEFGDDLYFTQFGLQISTDNANTYRGGMLGKLWQFRLGSDDEAVRIVQEHAGSISRPMVGPENLYFISDASGRDNIWMIDNDGRNAEQITLHDDLSIRGASLEDGQIVYQLGADIYLLDLSNRESRKLDIQIVSDHPSLREQWITDPLKYLTSAHLAGDFEKVVVTARGKTAIAGIDQERLVTVGSSTTTRLRGASLSHDGKSVYAISDTSGELELWRYDATGASNAEQLTEDGSTLRGSFSESPDGQWIAHEDGGGGLWLLDTETKENKQITGDSLGVLKFSWSPDSNLLAIAFNTDDAVGRPRIFLYDVHTGTQSFLTTTKYESYAPAFSRDGKWLYLLSNRNFEASFASPWQDRDFGPAFERRTEIFAHALTEDAEFPFTVPNELSTKSTEEEEGEDENDEEAEVAEIVVAWEGLEARVWQVPIEAGNYGDLLINEEFMYVHSYSTAPDVEPEVRVLKLEPQPKAETFTEKVTAIEMSDNGEMLFIWKQSGELPEMFIVPAGEKFPEDVSKNTVLASAWQFSIDPRLEWKQMFHDAWLMHREQFFDAEMRGVDWEAIREKYMPLVGRATDRRELNDVFAQMMGELNALHSQVRGGDVPLDPEAPKPAALGAKLRQTTDGVEIEHIYRYEQERPGEAPPLAKPGVNATTGDIISAINGIDTPTLESVHRALRNQAGKQVLLQLQRGSEDVKTVVVPAESRDDNSLRYSDWVSENRNTVEESDADLGYVHIRSMVNSDAGAFAREFYANINKKGMVIDVRRNNGGNIDSWIIDRLLRKAWSFWAPRQGAPYTNMQNAFRGHIVVLADERTYSDGETFVAAIKRLDIAPVIGKRTAGAGVWLSGRNRVVDNGIARVAEFPVYGMDGEWLTEGYGINPTIEVDNLPHATFNGGDAQLEAAIEYLQQKIEEEPIPELNANPFPEYGQPAVESANQ